MDFLNKPDLSLNQELLRTLSPENLGIYHEIKALLIESGCPEDEADEAAYRCFFVK